MKKPSLKIGDMVKLEPWGQDSDSRPTGIIVNKDEDFYFVKWFNSTQNDGGYLCRSLKKV